MINKIYNKFIYRSYIRKKLKSSGQKFRLGFHSEIHNPKFISIGENFYSGPHTYMGTNKANPIIIGNDVMFGAECMIIGGNHDTKYIKNHMIHNQEISSEGKPIIIENGVWIGTRSMIISGSKIGEGAVVGAMSLVNSQIPPYCIAVGIPVKVVKPRFDKREELQQLLSNVNSKFTIEDINSIYKRYSLPEYKTEEK